MVLNLISLIFIKRSSGFDLESELTKKPRTEEPSPQPRESSAQPGESSDQPVYGGSLTPPLESYGDWGGPLDEWTPPQGVSESDGYIGGSEQESVPDSDSEPNSESVPNSESIPKSESEQESVPNSEPYSDSESNSESVPGLKPGSEPDSEPDSSGSSGGYEGGSEPLPTRTPSPLAGTDSIPSLDDSDTTAPSDRERVWREIPYPEEQIFDPREQPPSDMDWFDDI